MRKNVTLKIDAKIYDSYVKSCGKKGMIISRQVENFMQQELKDETKRANK